MSPLARAMYRLLLSLLPEDARRRDGPAMIEAFASCLARERRRRPFAGAPYTWLRGSVDVLMAAVVIRADRRRAGRIALQTGPRLSRGDTMISRLRQDVRHAWRRMRQAPGFSLAVVLTRALATGATTAIFSVVDTVLWRPLPYPAADRLVTLFQHIARGSAAPIGFSAPDYLALTGRPASFVSMAAFANHEVELSGVSEPERINAARVSADLFRTLGVAPVLGRSFTREEDEGRQPVAILSEPLWRRQFGADPSVVGRAVMLDRRAYTVVGVMPRGFSFPSRGHLAPAIYVPISFSDAERGGFGSMYNNRVVARLKPDVTVAQADAEVRTSVQTAAREMYPSRLQGLAERIGASAVSLRDETVGRVGTLLLLFFAAVGVVLLIACADLASLLLTRAISRQREMAVRSALGAGRGRLLCQMLIETGVLAAVGTGLGLVLSSWIIAALVAAAPGTLPRLPEVRIDGRVLGFAAMLSVATALLCGLLPAFESTRGGVSDPLKEGGRTGSTSRRQRRILGAIVTTQVALAVVLLVGGGLLVRSFNRLMNVDPGFSPAHVLTMATSLPAAAYPEGAAVRAFYGRLLERLAGLPGVSAVATSTALPLGIRERRAFTIEPEPDATRELPHSVAHDWVAGRYFETMGIALRRGRYLAPEDHQAAERVVVINDTMARMYWLERDPVGDRIAWGNARSPGAWMRIVGVVADVKQGPLHSPVVPQTYQPWEQMSDSQLGETALGQFRSLRISVRTEMDPTVLTSAVRSEIRALDPALPASAVQSLGAIVAMSTAPERFNAVLIGAFGALALLLAALGIGGVLATSVSRRTQELGIRIALGARPARLRRMVLREGMTVAVIGLGIGLLAAFVVTRLMSTLLFDISPRDPLTFGTVAVVIVVVAFVASYVLARRATAVDPMAALRRE